MSFTRFRDDPARIQKQLEELTYSGRYLLNTPGQGTDMPYFEDPQIRLQGWGANFRKDAISIENDLLGLTRHLNRDLVEVNDYKNHAFSSFQTTYNNATPFIEESRSSHPAWMYKDLEQTRWEAPILDPIARSEKPFNDNIQTRILEKDYYKPKIPNNM
jgi:hypothetical protein